MASELTVSLICECDCNGKTTRSSRHHCAERFPAKPIEGTVTALRASAGARGWQVMAGKHGSDVCPPCRIAAIRNAAEPQDEAVAADAS